MIIPYLNMSCRIVIGNVRFENCSRINIDADLTDIGDTCTIILPRNIQKLKDKPVLDYIKARDAVTVEWGYNGKLTKQFEGYVRKIEAEAPLVIHCDDNWFPWKRNSIVKAYEAVSLKKLLTDILPGIEIDCPDIQLGKYPLNGESSFEILKRIQREKGLYIRLMGNQLTAAYAHKWQPVNTWKYHRQKNVRISNLKWQRKEDVNIKVEVEYEEKGVKKNVSRQSVGNDMQVVKKEAVNIGLGKKDAEELAEAKLQQYAFDGFTGSVTGFGVPDTMPGDRLNYTDDRYPEKAGEYVIERLNAEYAPAHIYRQNHLGRVL